jgi:MFS family permease
LHRAWTALPLTETRQIGNAESANFTADIGLEKSDLNTAVALFFAFFVALQPVGAALGRKYGMVAWVPTCMFLWGISTALHAWVRHRWQLYALRIIIGCLEGTNRTPAGYAWNVN